MNARQAISKMREEQAAPAAGSARLTLRNYVMGEDAKRRLADVASKYMPPEEIARCVLVAASRNPKIADCTQDSIMRCMMEAAIMGVRPGGILGRGYLIPRWNGKIKAHELNFDPGWRGLADIARRSKVVRDIDARVVYERDHFRRIEGSAPRLEHEPYDGEDTGELRYAYAVAFFEGDHTKFEVLRRSDIEKIKHASTSRNDKGELVGPWVEWEDEMWRKSAVRRLCKHLPADEELEYALEVSTRAEMAAEAPSLPAETEETPRAQKLADRIRAGQRAPEPPPSDPAMAVGDDPAGLAAP